VYFLIYQSYKLYSFFFFQEADGIRYFHVTGVQTCALPILPVSAIVLLVAYAGVAFFLRKTAVGRHVVAVGGNPQAARVSGISVRSEERRVGKEGRSWSGPVA